MRRWLKRLLVLVVLVAPLVGVVILDRMFPSVAALGERPLPAKRATPARAVAARLVDLIPEVHGARPAALAQARRYRYLRDSPYLPAHRAARDRVFNVAAGDVLLAAALDQVKHQGAVFEGRYAVRVAGGETLDYAVPIHADARLQTAVTVLPAFAAGEATCGGRASIHVDGAEVWAAQLDVTGPFSWRPVDVALPPGVVRLGFERAPGCAAEGHAFFADPVVHVPSESRPLNLLYLNICTVRADDLGSYGQARPTSPRLDALAAGGLRFTTARANGNWSKSSQMSAVLGRYPSTIGNQYFRTVVRPYAEATIRHAAWPGLPSILRARGYATVALVDNVFIHPFLNLGIDLGFDRVVDDGRHLFNGAALTDMALEMLEAQGDRPFFLYMNIANAHAKYRPPREDLYRSGFGLSDLTGDLQRALHLGEVAFTDRQLGRILDGLERLGLREDTLVVVHADHGELLDADRDLEVTVRSTLVPRVIKRYGPTRYKHGWTWFEDELRVPLMFSLPGRLSAAVRQEPVSLIDVAPTLLEVLGVPQPATMHGRSLLTPAPRPTYVEGKQFRAVFEGPYKFVRFAEGMSEWRPRGGAWRDTPSLLHDLSVDRRETEDLADPSLRQRMQVLLERLTPRTAPLHLVAFQGPAGTVFSGRVHGALTVQSLRDHAPGDHFAADGRFSITAGPNPPPILAFSTADPPRISVRADGDPLAPSNWRLGPHALPLVAEQPPFETLDAAPLAQWMAVSDGQQPVFDGQPRTEPGLHWWTQRVGEGGPEPFATQAVDASLIDAMKDWGYAH